MSSSVVTRPICGSKDLFLQVLRNASTESFWATTNAGYQPLDGQVLRMKRLRWTGEVTAGAAASSMTATVYKNAVSGAGAEIFSLTQTLVAAVVFSGEDIAVNNAGNDIITSSDNWRCIITTTGTATVNDLSLTVEWEYL